MLFGSQDAHMAKESFKEQERVGSWDEENKVGGSEIT